MYPINYELSINEGYGGTTSANSYVAPLDWEGHVEHYEDIAFISFGFHSKWGSGVSLLPGNTETFSIITPTKDDGDGIIDLLTSGGARSKEFYYDKNTRGYVNGHYSYREIDAVGKNRVYSYPMQPMDQTAPVISVTLTPTTLPSPNSTSIPITATVTVTDDYDPEPEIKLESITATETLDATDIQDAQLGSDDRSFSLKAAHTTTAAARIYTVTYSATDASGNKSTATATVTVF